MFSPLNMPDSVVDGSHIAGGLVVVMPPAMSGATTLCFKWTLGVIAEVTRVDASVMMETVRAPDHLTPIIGRRFAEDLSHRAPQVLPHAAHW